MRFVAQSGQRIEHADLFLFPAVDYHGRVVDAHAEPVALDAHEYVLVASVPERPIVTSEVVSPGAEVELRVPDGLRSRGRLVDEQGEAVAAGTVASLAVDGLGPVGTRVLLDLVHVEGQRQQVEVERRLIRQG